MNKLCILGEVTFAITKKGVFKLVSEGDCIRLQKDDRSAIAGWKILHVFYKPIETYNMASKLIQLLEISSRPCDDDVTQSIMGICDMFT